MMTAGGLDDDRYHLNQRLYQCSASESFFPLALSITHTQEQAGVASVFFVLGGVCEDCLGLHEFHSYQLT